MENPSFERTKVCSILSVIPHNIYKLLNKCNVFQDYIVSTCNYHNCNSTNLAPPSHRHLGRMPYLPLLYWDYSICLYPSFSAGVCLNRFGGLVVRASAPEAGGCGFDPRPSHTKRLTKMVLTTASLDAHH